MTRLKDTRSHEDHLKEEEAEARKRNIVSTRKIRKTKRQSDREKGLTHRHPEAQAETRIEENEVAAVVAKTGNP